MKTSKYQLKNGLQVILSENHRSPVVSVQMWVRTGSADEKKKEEGISHFIEHLVFKGTQKFNVGEIASRIEGDGGELNAYTSFDQTVFYVTISKQFTDTALLAISEMMGFPTFDPAEINNEREVVIEEIKRGKDSLGRKASELLFSNNYRKHPYGIPVIGYEKNIKTMSAKKIVEFFHSRYAPRNMFLLVSGNFETPEMKKKVQALFGEFKDYKIKKVSRTKEPKQTSPRVMIEKTGFEQSLAYVSWKIPNVKHKDVPALDTLGMILGAGDSSRLVQKLRIQSATVNSVGAGTYTPQDDGLFTVSFGYNKEKLSQALDGIKEVILGVLAAPPTEEEIKKSVLNVESEEFFSLETVDGLSRKMGSLEFYFKDLKAQERYIREIRALTSADLLKIAKKYFVPATLSVSIATNDEEKAVQKIVNEWVKNFKKELGKVKSKKVKPKKVKHEKLVLSKKVAKDIHTEKVKLKNGVTVLMRQTSDTQVVAVKSAFLGGLRVEPDSSEGLTELLGRTWTCGTKTRSEEEISEEIEKMASGMSPIAGRNSIGLGLDILSSFQEKGADLFFDVLKNPTFPAEPLEREKLVLLEQIKSRSDNPSQVCGRLFMKAMFDGHPYSRDMMGSEESTAKVTHKAIMSQYDKMNTTENMTIMLGGNFDKDMWLEKIEKTYSGHERGSRQIGKFPLKDIKEDIYLYESTKKEQSHVMYGFRGLPLASEDRYTLQIIQSILAGQGGRLFIELRDKNSLAYSVSPMRLEGVETGYFGAYIGCSPEKVNKAISMMKEQFDLLSNELVPAGELDRAKRYMVGRHDIDLQRTGSVVTSVLYNDIYGIDFNEPFTCAEKYFAVTPEKIRSLSQKIFGQKSIISVVGPTDPRG